MARHRTAKTPARITKECRAGLRFSVARVERDLRAAAGHGMRLSEDAPVFVAAVLEGLVASILYRANLDQGEGRGRITPDMLAKSMRGSKNRSGEGGLDALLDGVDMSGSSTTRAMHASVATAKGGRRPLSKKRVTRE